MVVTGAQPPIQGAVICYMFVSIKGACPKQYTNPLPVHLLLVWKGMHVHEVD